MHKERFGPVVTYHLNPNHHIIKNLNFTNSCMHIGMKIDEDLIEKLSRLSYLEFRDEEREKIRTDLERILNFVEKLKELDTKDVEPLIYLSENTDVLDPDKIDHTIPRNEALRNAPDHNGEFFKVPKVIRKGKNKP